MSMKPGNSILPPSAWVRRFGGLVPRHGRILDLAAGGGRHSRYFKDLGHPVTAVDRDLSGLASAAGGTVELIEADLEDGSDWPLADREFAGIVVTNYLHRPLFPHIAAALAPHGILIYETFGEGNARFGKPSNPAFLLAPGELLEFSLRYGFAVLAYECGEVTEPKPAVIQRAVMQRLR